MTKSFNPAATSSGVAMSWQRKALFIGVTGVLVVLLSGSVSALDINDSSDLRYFSSDQPRLYVDSGTADVTLFGDLLMQQQNISDPDYITNYFDGACQDGEVVNRVYPDGTYDCVNVDAQATDQNLESTLTDGNWTGDRDIVVNGTNSVIDMRQNNIIDIGDLTGNDIVNSAQIASGAVGSGELDESQSYALNWSNLDVEQAHVSVSDLGTADAQLDMGGLKIVDLQNPDNPQDAATMDYVDSQTSDVNESATQTLEEVLGEGHWTNGQNILVNGSSVLDMSGNTLQGLATLQADGTEITMDDTVDLAGDNLVDNTNGVTIYDSTGPHVPLTALEADSITVNAGAFLSGGDTVQLGNSVTLDVADNWINASDEQLGDGISWDGTAANVGAGNGLTISGNDVAIATGGVDTNELNTDAVDNDALDNTLAFTMAGLTVEGDAQVQGDLDVWGNITNTEVNNLQINGSLLPPQGYSGDFDVGNATRQWRDADFAGTVAANTVNADTINQNGNQVIDTISGNAPISVSESGNSATVSISTPVSLQYGGTGADLSGASDNPVKLSGDSFTTGAIDLSSEVTGTLPISEGGTGASSASDARDSLTVAQAADCPSGQVVQNATTGGLECVTVDMDNTDELQDIQQSGDKLTLTDSSVEVYAPYANNSAELDGNQPGYYRQDLGQVLDEGNSANQNIDLNGNAVTDNSGSEICIGDQCS